MVRVLTAVPEKTGHSGPARRIFILDFHAPAFYNGSIFYCTSQDFPAAPALLRIQKG